MLRLSAAALRRKRLESMNDTRSNYFRKKNETVSLFSHWWALLRCFCAFLGRFMMMESTLKTVFEDVETENKREEEVSVDATHPISFALLGIDMYGDGIAEGSGRSIQSSSQR